MRAAVARAAAGADARAAADHAGRRPCAGGRAGGGQHDRAGEGLSRPFAGDFPAAAPVMAQSPLGRAPSVVRRGGGPGAARRGTGGTGVTRAERPPVYTIGHSTRSNPAFVELLRCGQVDLVLDIRSIPRSRTNPLYNLDVLPDALAAYQIGHERIELLGGRRPKSTPVAPEVNGFWPHQSFHNYADYALTGEFRAGLARLGETSRARRCAIMCSEAVWWRCHRRLVAAYLLRGGREVFHLMGPARVEAAKMTPAARPAGVSLVYPAAEATLP